MAVIGLKELQAKLAKMPERAKAEMAKELDRGANEIAALARGLAPVKSGTLKASIQVEKGRHELSRKVVAGGGDAFYARFVEFGHGHAKPRPFFFPAYRALRKSIKNRLARACTKAAKSAAGDGGYGS